MGIQNTMDIRTLFPASNKDAHKRLSSFSVASFLGDSPLTATLVVAGTANDTAASLHTMQLPQYPQMLQRAQTLYDAQLAYYRGELETAKQLAIGLFNSIQPVEIPASPEEADQLPTCYQKLGASYLIGCLARHHIKRYWVDEALRYMKALVGHGTKLSQTAEVYLSMYELSIGIMSDIPEWIRTGDLRVLRIGDRLAFDDEGVLPDNLYPATIAAMEYATYRNDHRASIMLADHAKRVYGMRGYLIGDAYLCACRAVNYEALGFADEAERSLREAVRLVSPDGLWLIVMEFSAIFGDRLPAIVRSISAEGADRCEALAHGFLDRIYDSHHEEIRLRGHQPLTNQELAVMRLAAQGHSNAEIATQLHVALVTVKFHKKNAYRKLGINRQTHIDDALRKHEISAEWIKDYPKG